MSPASTRREHLAQRGKMIGMRKQHSAYPQSDSGRAGGIPAPRAGANGPTMYGRALLRVRAFRAEVGVREGGYYQRGKVARGDVVEFTRGPACSLDRIVRTRSPCRSRLLSSRKCGLPTALLIFPLYPTIMPATAPVRSARPTRDVSSPEAQGSPQCASHRSTAGLTRLRTDLAAA